MRDEWRCNGYVDVGTDSMGGMTECKGDGSASVSVRGIYHRGRCTSVGGRPEFTVGRVHPCVSWLNPWVLEVNPYMVG